MEEIGLKAYEYPICPKCGKRNTIHTSFRKISGVHYRGVKCRNCGNSFIVTEKNNVRETKQSSFDALSFFDRYEKTSTNNETYTQVWSVYNEAKTSEKEMFIKILLELLELLKVDYRKRKGHPNNDLHDMIFACAIKVYSGLSSRRAVSELELLKRIGFIEQVPHFNTLLNYFNNEQMTDILKKLIELSSLPLKQIEEDFAVDSSGFSTSIFSRWFDHKWGKTKDKRYWVKCHLMSGVKTNVVSSVEITHKNKADTTQFTKLVKDTAKNFTLKEVSADRAYSGRENLETVSNLGAIPYIPFKSNATGKRTKSVIWKRMFEYFAFHREEFLEHYHKRSNAESVFHSLKMKFGNSVKCKTMTGMTNEILVKVLCYNICVLIQEIHELGIAVNFNKENQGKLHVIKV